MMFFIAGVFPGEHDNLGRELPPAGQSRIIEIRYQPVLTRCKIVGMRAPCHVDQRVSVRYQSFSLHVRPIHPLPGLVLGVGGEYRLGIALQQLLRRKAGKHQLHQLPVAFVQITPLVEVVKNPVLYHGMPRVSRLRYPGIDGGVEPGCLGRFIAGDIFGDRESEHGRADIRYVQIIIAPRILRHAEYRRYFRERRQGLFTYDRLADHRFHGGWFEALPGVFIVF